MADTSSVGHDVVCPDPSVHEAAHRHSRLQEQASTAALYATHPPRSADGQHGDYPENPLDADGKLSSKSAAASLKHAKPQDLPSFPSAGNTANSASKAALLAKDYKMDPLWQPAQSLAGSKAALLAQAKGGNVELWQASATSDGYSAATLAMRNKGLSPKVDYNVTAENKKKALLAATKSHNHGRSRAGSTPSAPLPAYPDSHNSGVNALNAATISHKASVRSTADGWDSQANQAARIKNSHIDPAMFGERPPVEIERDEAKHQAALRASAVSMAKQIMESQDRTAMTADPADIAGAQAAAARTQTSPPADIKQEAMRYINLQEAAHKLAAERLAKVDKNFEASQYREYYGYSDKPKRLSSRLSMRSTGGGRQRKRASSEGTADLDDSDDEGQARRIRSQMSQLNSGLSNLDEKKQQDDRAKLLAAAEKSVSARMHKMDERVFADTGKVPPALMEEWEEKARQRAQAERELQAQHPGKTHVGGGKFMDQSEIEAIAAARLKPTLDEISTTAERKRARDEEVRQEKEEQERQKREEKATKKEEKDEQKRIKNEEKARKDEEKRVAKEEKRKSREAKREEAKEAAAVGAAGATLAEVAENVKDDDEPATAGASAGIQRHKSALSRLKDRFRKSQAGDSESDQQQKETATTGTSTEATVTSTEAVAPDVVALDAQQAAHAVETEEGEKTVTHGETADQTIHAPVSVDNDADIEDDDTQKWKPVEPAAAAVSPPRISIEEPEPTSSKKAERPPFEQKPSLSGYHNDELPLHNEKPDLERHISQIPESDGDSSDEDWNDEREPLGKGTAQDVVDRVIAAPVVAVDPPIPSEQTLAQMNNQRAEPPKDLPTSLESPGVPKAAVATIPATESAAADGETYLMIEDEKRDPSILREVIYPQEKDFDESGRDTTAQASTSHAATSSRVETAQTAVVGSTTTQATSAQAATASEESRAKDTNEHAKLRKKQLEPVDTQDKERKGVRGFFHKLRHRESRSENKLVEAESPSSRSIPYDSMKDGQAPTMMTPKESTDIPNSPTSLPPVDVGPSLGERVGTDGPIGDSTHVSGIDGNPRAESPSSFKRGEGETNDPDDVSSSGVDEEDISRGRAGRLARKLGLGSRKGKAKAKDDTRASTDDKRKNSDGTEEEQYEEARDHFDENLAPPPAFAGQAKSESPSRETRFQEQL